MKIILITLLSILPIKVYAIEFYQCVDANGQRHYTNLPAESLDSNCMQNSDRFDYLLKQDYSNLSNGYNRIKSNLGKDKNTFSIGNLELMIPHKDMFDSDVAAEELLETTARRNDPVTRFLREGREALEDASSTNRQSPNSIRTP